MHFSEQPPSQQWAALNYKGRTIAEVWFKPEGGDPFTLSFRLPPQTFQLPGLPPFLTAENLLKAVAIPIQDVENWGHDLQTLSEVSLPLAELSQPLQPPSEGESHVRVFVRLKQTAPKETTSSGTLSSQWQYLMTRWNTIIAAEVNIDTLRLRMEGLRAEMETAVNKSLTTDEKLNAFNADVAQWSKAKSRARYTLPKAKEFVHRATWAMGTPERKKLEELFKYDAQPTLAQVEMDRLRIELDNLLKDRQILAAQGVSALQECNNGSSDMKNTLLTLQRNAAAHAQKKRIATRAKK